MNLNIKFSAAALGIMSILSFALNSCGLDNYDAPESRLHGRIVYDGQPLGLRSTAGAVQLQLYQYGYAKRDPIPVFVDQNGEFSAQLFSGDYKLVTRDGNGPWVNSRDTLDIHVEGYTEYKLEVTPYFMFGNYSITIENDIIKASAAIEKVVQDAVIDRVILAVGETRFVDEYTNIGQINAIPDQEMNIEASIDITSEAEYKNARHLFARLGVRAAGADQYLFTPVIQLK